MGDLIRQALGWATGSWPPDYYTLLGLSPGPTNPDQIEAAVLERMEKLRVFQLVHPESVTEAMNLLARALITLSDPAAKANYDRELPARPALVQIETSDNLEVEPAKNADLVPPALPQPVAVPSSIPPPLPPIPLVNAAESVVEPITRQPTPLERSLASEWPSPPTRQTVRPKRRRHKSTEQTVVRWVVQLRQVLNAWDEAGSWLAIPELTFATRIEAVEVILALRQIARSAPAIIDVNGPGAAVLNLAQSRPTSTILMDVTSPHREQLARDWRKGRKIILDEYERTRRRMRRQSRRFRIRQPWQTTMAAWALMAFAIATVLIVVVRSWRGV